ncbi:yippee-domain-containing protein [Xylariaceae sp. FL0594]|nr:yippee-domain-containing protein [Xylariaceae sp. FL0594]
MLSMILNDVVSSRPPPRTQAASANTSTTTGALVPPPRFPTFLLPSFPTRLFRRRASSISDSHIPTPDDVPSLSNSPTDSVTSADGHSTSDGPLANGLSFIKRSLRRSSAEPAAAPGSRLTKVQPDTIRCSGCGTDLAFSSQIVSKGFTGRHGRAYLVAPPDSSSGTPGGDLVNIKVGKPEPRNLTTGLHTVSDIHCAICRAKVGWKYVDAKEESQKYKVGRFILETRRTVEHKNWEDVIPSEVPDVALEPGEMVDGEGEGGETIVFDSDDESECDDIFAGVWNAQTAAKRRKHRGIQR